MTPADQTQVVWHALSPDETCARLQTRRDGLSEAEAGERLAQHGANTLPEAPALGVARTVLKQFASPLIYLLLAAGLLSLVIGDRWDAIFIFGVLATNAQLVTRIVEIIERMGGRAVTPQEARNKLKLRGGDS